MAREIGPMHRCGPGGDCPYCCAPILYCAECGEVEVNGREDLCEDCAERVELDAQLDDVLYDASRDEPPGADWGSP